MKTTKFLLLLVISAMFIATDANAKGKKAAGRSGGGECINDNCKSVCDNGNTLWGQPGQVQKCVWNSDEKGFRPETLICSDGRIPNGGTFNSATMEYVKGGEDASRQRCWGITCKNGNRFRGDPTTGMATGSGQCMPCTGAMIYALKIEDTNSEIKYSLEKRSKAADDKAAAESAKTIYYVSDHDAGRFSTKTFDKGATVTCNNLTFTDPHSGAPKSCRHGSVGGRKLASENGTFTMP